MPFLIGQTDTDTTLATAGNGTLAVFGPFTAGASGLLGRGTARFSTGASAGPYRLVVYDDVGATLPARLARGITAEVTPGGETTTIFPTWTRQPTVVAGQGYWLGLWSSPTANVNHRVLNDAAATYALKALTPYNATVDPPLAATSGFSALTGYKPTITFEIIGLSGEYNVLPGGWGSC